MMNLTEAISLLAPFHDAQVICVVRKESGKFDAQLTTGNLNIPTIPVNDGMVTTDDLFEVIDDYNEAPILFPSLSPQEVSIWGVYAA